MNHFTHLDDMTILAIGVVIAVVLMIVLRGTGKRLVVPTARLKLSGDGAYAYDIGGADAYQLAMERIGGSSSFEAEHECTAELVPEPPKPGTVSAIHVKVEGATVGFIAPEEAALFHEVLRGRPARCEAIIMGARGYQAVMLDLKWPPTLV